MNEAPIHCDPEADRLWRCCRRDRDLRLLLERVLSSQKPAFGRALLLSAAEVFGEIQAQSGAKLSLLFRLTGYPYLSGSLKDLSKSLRRISARHSKQPDQSRDAKIAIANWAKANGRQAQNIFAAAILETVRQNPGIRSLTNSDQPITPVMIAKAVPNFEALDWKPMQELLQLFDSFLARAPSKKALNRFTLNFTALLRYFQPEMIHQELIWRSAHHFVLLLRKREVSEADWRDLLIWLINRRFVVPNTGTYYWCPRSSSKSFGNNILDNSSVSG